MPRDLTLSRGLEGLLQHRPALLETLERNPAAPVGFYFMQVTNGSVDSGPQIKFEIKFGSSIAQLDDFRTHSRPPSESAVGCQHDG